MANTHFIYVYFILESDILISLGLLSKKAVINRIKNQEEVNRGEIFYNLT